MPHVSSKQTETGTKTVLVLEKALLILEHLAKHPCGIVLKDLTNEVKLNKSTVYRILDTLQQHGYVRQNASNGSYRLSYKFFVFSNALLDLDIKRVAEPFLMELASLTQEVVHLVVRDEDEGVYIDKMDGYSNEAVRIYSRIGSRVPLHSTSVGKVLLAYMPEEDVRAIAQRTGLAARTPFTITSLDRLLEELSNIRENGYAVDDMENEENVRCVAAPIRMYDGSVVSALSVSSTTLHLKLEGIPRIASQVKEYAQMISKELGYRQV